MKINIGTRPGRLARAQAEEMINRFPGIDFSVSVIDTPGDRDKSTPLRLLEGTNFFTRDIEEALLGRRIDAAVHSAKDLENDTPEGLTVAAVTLSRSALESLVSSDNSTLEELPEGSVVGVSSRRRRAGISRFRRGLILKDIRGNIDERLAQLDNGSFDAIVVAHAALLRLDYADRISGIISPDIVEHHPLQGRLAVQVLSGRKDLIELFGRIHEK